MMITKESKVVLSSKPFSTMSNSCAGHVGNYFEGKFLRGDQTTFPFSLSSKSKHKTVSMQLTHLLTVKILFVSMIQALDV